MHLRDVVLGRARARHGLEERAPRAAGLGDGGLDRGDEGVLGVGAGRHLRENAGQHGDVQQAPSARVVCAEGVQLDAREFELGAQLRDFVYEL